MEYKNIIKRHNVLIPCPGKEDADRYVREQREDGAFLPAAKEKGQENPDFPINHCRIIRELASAGYRYGEERYRTAAARGISYWRNLNFQGASNWFYNSILIPRMLLDIVLLMGEQMEEGQRRYLIKEVKRAYTKERYVYDIGANIVWTNMITLHLACVLEDEALYLQAAARINEEMRFASQHTDSDRKWRGKHWRGYADCSVQDEVYEGVQDDYSFFEHGPLLHTGAYGKAYLYSLCQLMYECRGTKTLLEDSCRFLMDYLLEHFRWTMIRENQDYNVIGRKIGAKKGQGSMEPAISFGQLLTLLENSEISYRRREIAETRLKLERGENPVSGLRYYPRGRYLIGQSDALSVGVRMTCRGMLSSESVNWENLKCWYLGNGTSFIYTDGKDYDGVFPVYDWRKIPGTTAENRERPPLDWKQHIAVEGSESVLCGGITEKEIGAAAMELKKDGLRARKAWIFMEGEWVCLGSGISCTGGDDICTTVNQMKKRGGLWINGKPEEGKILLQEAAWVGHCRVGYVFPEGQRVRITSGKRKGDWNDIAYDQSPGRPDTPCWQEEDMVTIWLEHGTMPSGAGYEYHMVPWREGQVPETRVKVVANCEAVQAAVVGGCGTAVFWQEGEYWLEGRRVDVKRPCILLYNRGKISRMELDIRRQEEKKGENEASIRERQHQDIRL